MNMMRRWALVLASVVLLTAVAGGAAHASGGGSGHGDPHGAPAAHGAAGEHGAAGGEHHLCYTCDDDGDHTANWLDNDSDAYVLVKLGFHAVNFALFAGLLIWLAGPTVRDALRARSLEVRKELDEAARLKTEAAARHEAVSKRLASIEDEIRDIRGRARSEAEAEERRIHERAREAAVRIAEGAQRQIRDETARAKFELRREAVELAVQLAESVLKTQVSAVDQKRLAIEFLETVASQGGEGVSSHG
jgi:F-type H+-transporting ATPase subunit b